MYGYRLCTVLSALSGSCTLLAVGCHAPPQRLPAVTESEPRHATFELPAAPGWPAAEQTAALRCDHGAAEVVLAEVRLAAGLARHSFASDGLDFDPDVCDGLGLLVFASTGGSPHPDIFLKVIDGTTITQLTDDPADDIEPRFSPDGERIVFCSNRAGNWDIWMMSRDGSGLTQLTHDLADEMAPAWSPDGTRLAYCTWSRRSHQWEIWLLDVASPYARRFVTFGMFPAWSPAGTRLAFQRARERGSPQFSIWTVELTDDGEADPIVVAEEGAVACIAPAWSPDESQIVYCVVRNADDPQVAVGASPLSAELWVADLRGGGRTRLTNEGEPCFNPMWCSDGRVYFVSTRSGTENVWSIDMDWNASDASTAVRGEGQQVQSPATFTIRGN